MKFVNSVLARFLSDSIVLTTILSDPGKRTPLGESAGRRGPAYSVVVGRGSACRAGFAQAGPRRLFAKDSDFRTMPELDSIKSVFEYRVL